MLGEKKSLFDNYFFDSCLKLSAINNQEFVIRHFTIDSRIKEDGDLYCFVGVRGEKFDGNDFFENAYENNIRVFVLDKKPNNIPKDAIVYLVDDAVQALADLASNYKDELLIPHIMITGSVGKTTTRLLLTAILKQKYKVHTAQKNWNNALGTPLTILATPHDAHISVLEAGMNSLGEIAHLSHIVNPDIAIITNIGSSHVGMLGSVEKIAEAKIEIAEGMNENSLLIVPNDERFNDLFFEKSQGHMAYYDPEILTLIEDKNLDGFTFSYRDAPDMVFRCPLVGVHLLQNLSIVFSLLDILQIPLDVIQEGLDSIKGLDNRMRVFENKKGVKVIADCYNASLESFKVALDVLGKSSGRKIAVIGSVLELGSESNTVHKEIGEYLELKKIDLVLAIGEEISHTCMALKKTPYCHLTSKEEAWNILEKEIQKGDTVLIKASNGIGLSVLVQCLESI